MIKIFQGSWRGIGVNSADSNFGMILDFKFRQVLANFKGASLAVFMAIALHSDSEGLSFPSRELIAKETGYTVQTVSQALEYLCKLEITGQRVLLKEQARANGGTFAHNVYRIFPTASEIEAATVIQKTIHGDTVSGFTVDGSTVDGKPDSKLNQSLKLNQSKEEYAPLFGDDRAGKQRKRTVETIGKGLQAQEDLLSRLRVIGLNPNLNTKSGKLFVEFIRDRESQGETLEVFHTWWKANDWRGKQGQPPTITQIQELWFAAFTRKVESVHPDPTESADLCEAIEAWKNSFTTMINNISQSQES